MTKPTICRVSVNDPTEPDRYIFHLSHRQYDLVSLLQELSEDEQRLLLEALDVATASAEPTAGYPESPYAATLNGEPL